jgi:hypothetical protein
MTDNDFTLGELRDVISHRYRPIRIGVGEGRTVQLVQIARLPDDRQEQLILMQGDFKLLREEGAALNAGAKDVTPEQVAEWATSLDHDPTLEEIDQFKRGLAAEGVSHDEIKAFKKRTIDVLERMLRLVCQSDSDAEALIGECNHDEVLLMEVFSRYSKTTKLGEASASPSSSESTAGPSSMTSENSSGSTSGQ